MTAFSINDNAEHPGFKGAMRLADAAIDTQFVSFDPCRGGMLLVTTLATSWSAVEIPLVGPEDNKIGAYPSIVATDIFGRTIRLTARGMHPYLDEDNRWSHLFSVIAEPEPIIRLKYWLENKGFVRSAKEVQDTFFEFFTDESFFDNLVRGGRP